jgi:hypothetical protein
MHDNGEHKGTAVQKRTHLVENYSWEVGLWNGMLGIL